MKSTMEYTLSYDVSKMIDDVSTMFYDVHAMFFNVSTNKKNAYYVV